MTKGREFALAAGAALALIAVATLFPGDPSRGGWQPAFPSSADLAVNIALFIPLGLAFRLRGTPVVRTVLAALFLSAGLEMVQLLVVPGRAASPWDVVANLAGTGAGRLLPPLILSLPLVVAWLAGPLLLAPAAPASPRWWGQWAHHFSGTIPFGGRILALDLNGVAAPDRQLTAAATSAMRTGFTTPEITLRAELLPARHPDGLVHLATVADGEGRQVAGFWQRGPALEVAWHARGTAIGLRTPAVLAGEFLAGLPDSAVTVQAWIGNGHWFVALGGPVYERRAGLSLGPWQGWRLLWPLAPPPPLSAWLISAAWSLACLGPLAGVLVALFRSRPDRTPAPPAHAGRA